MAELTLKECCKLADRSLAWGRFIKRHDPTFPTPIGRRKATGYGLKIYDGDAFVRWLENRDSRPYRRRNEANERLAR